MICYSLSGFCLFHFIPNKLLKEEELNFISYLLIMNINEYIKLDLEIWYIAV